MHDQLVLSATKALIFNSMPVLEKERLDNLA